MLESNPQLFKAGEPSGSTNGVKGEGNWKGRNINTIMRIPHINLPLLKLNLFIMNTLYNNLQ